MIIDDEAETSKEYWKRVSPPPTLGDWITGVAGAALFVLILLIMACP